MKPNQIIFLFIETLNAGLSKHSSSESDMSTAITGFTRINSKDELFHSSSNSIDINNPSSSNNYKAKGN